MNAHTAYGPTKIEQISCSWKLDADLANIDVRMFLAMSLLNFLLANKILLDTSLLNYLCFLLYLAFIVTVRFLQILKGT